MKHLAFAFAVISLLGACSKKSNDSKSSSKSKDSAPAVTIDVAGVNALVPAELKDKVVFEQRDLVEEGGRANTTYTMAAPKDWEAGEMKMIAKLKPKDSALFMTQLSVGHNCDGKCEKKDWAAIADKANFAQFADGKIVKDEVGKTNRLMIAEKSDTTYVTYAWWTESSPHYFTCSAYLDAPIAAAAPAFAKACQAVSVKGK